MAPINSTANSPRIFSIRKATSIISGEVSPDCTIVITTDNIAMARISSTIAAPRISLASLDCILPSSVST